ncbi:hypothetical protein GJU43_14085 [Flavobacterium sp. LC2016-23]|uniref:hypothetical protein n=1 Tax=Flavobacterium sp. LC2016-23 TaxID=2666330 RepID=UPI0012B0108F|nr:hypothetical protein [Flavobacterium sp. LC2016-23]MRX40413.1 hypothetical protein [Flavobacterium sp. LC2016-23]
MQTAYEIFNSLGAIVGNFSIISGCILTGTNVSDGFVFINGELLPFKGGVKTTNVIISETKQSLEFEDGNSNEVKFIRQVTFGTATIQYPWADFKRGFETKGIPAALESKGDKTDLDELILRVTALEEKPSNIPIGLIAIWGRPLEDIPAGWEEYVNLRGRMPFGLNPDDPDFATLGSASGNKNKKLSVAELPKISPINGSALKKGGTGGGTDGLTVGDYGTGDFAEGQLIKPFGGDQEFSIMNPYRIVHFIRYKG